MNLSDIGVVFNRALSYTFSKKKLLLVYGVLLACGLLVVFFRGLAVQSGAWTLLSLTFLPIFLSVGILLALGIILVRIYHDEIKKVPVSQWEIFTKSWDTLIGASYFTVPILLGYLALWLVFAVYMLLKAVPGIGEFFGVILAFVPFILNVGILSLVVLSWALLFFASPVIALREMDRARIVQVVLYRIAKDPFFNILLAFIGLIPLALLGGFAMLALCLTEAICFSCLGPLQRIVETFFILIPFVALITPAVIFFFNFAAESHVLLRKRKEV